MKDTKIRWAGSSWNFLVGCSKVSPGCDHCYAEAIATKFTGPAFPHGFEPTFKPQKLDDPRGWPPQRIFVNSMSDLHHPEFGQEVIDEGYDRMLGWDFHDYLCLTKRPQRMWAYLTGGHHVTGVYDGWMARRRLDHVPRHIWLGTSIESNEFVRRADWLRRIPAGVRFLSLEPLLGPLPDLDLNGIHWVIVGGESGPGHRPMNHAWARELRDRCRAAGVAFFFKQSSAARTEMGVTLDGERIEEYPLPHPALKLPRDLGVYVDGQGQGALL